MTYSEFVEQLKSRAQNELGYEPEMIEFLPEGYTSDDPGQREWIQDCNKRFMGLEADFLLIDMLILKSAIGEQGMINAQRVAVRRMYEESEKYGFDAAFDQIRKNRKSMTAFQKEALNRRGTATYEEMREQLILRPLNYRLHRDNLKDCVYRRVGDLVLVLYQFLGDANNSITTSKIKKDEVEQWGMADRMEKVMQDALENTARLFPPSVYDKRTQKEVNFLTEDFTREDITYENSNMILLSTTKTTNGAVALFYPGVIEKMMKIMDGSFSAVFMNINDVMIFSRSDPRAARCADAARNSSQLGEMLSGRYYFCSEKGVTPA